MDDNSVETRRLRNEQEEQEREKELESIRVAIQCDISSVEVLEKLQSTATSKTRQIESDISSMLAEGENLEKEITLKRKTLEMLPSAADNISKLQTICAGSAKRLMQLAQEWEIHRRSLIDSLRERKRAKTLRKAKCKNMVDDMKRFREEMQNMIIDLKDKQDRAQALSEELNKLPRNINRNLVSNVFFNIVYNTDLFLLLQSYITIY